LPDNTYNPIFAQMGQGVSQICAQEGYVTMQFIGQRNNEEQTLFSLLRSRHFDGVVLISGEYDDPCPAFLKNSEIPYARIGHDPNHDDFKTVDVDNVEGARIAVEHLTSLGHRRIAILKGLARDTASAERFEGYKQALSEAGIELDQALVGDGDWSAASGYRFAKSILKLPDPPTALFSSNDIMVAGVVRAAHEYGVHVPNELAIVGFDDLDQTTMIFPELTTMRQPCVEMGEIAARMLIEQLVHETVPPEHVVLHPTLIIRESCGAARRRS
jgi:LacI family transcriptional regulator